MIIIIIMVETKGKGGSNVCKHERGCWDSFLLSLHGQINSIAHFKAT